LLDGRRHTADLGLLVALRYTHAMPTVIVDISIAIMRKSKSMWSRPGRENKEGHEEEKFVNHQTKTDNETG
jgi:hypothetical protein